MIKPMPAYFVVRIPRDKQKERKDKIGSIYLHPNYVYMTRNMQCGEIVSIGRDAQQIFPEAQVGQTLLFHHFVEGFNNDFLVDTDDDYGYFVVTACSHNGQNNQAYGVWTGKEIIPNQDYIFLSPVPPPEVPTTGQHLNHNLATSEGGIVVFQDWKDSKGSKMAKMAELKKEIEHLCKSKMTDQIKKVIEMKEAEAAAIRKEVFKQRFELYIVEAINPLFNMEVAKIFGTWVLVGEKVYMLNIACETIVEFNKKEFIVAKTQHMGMPLKWIQKQDTLKQFVS
jgi:hypothetical protein